MTKRKRSKIEKEVDTELEAKTKEELLAEFDHSQALHVPAKKRESKLISIRLPMILLKQLRDIAIKKGDIGYQQLIRTYLAEGVEREEIMNKWPYHINLSEVTGMTIFVWYKGEGKSSWRSSRYSRVEPPAFDVSTNRLLELKERSL